MAFTLLSSIAILRQVLPLQCDSRFSTTLRNSTQLLAASRVIENPANRLATTYNSCSLTMNAADLE